ncbi:MAG: phosphoglucomutase/phosphomannomutase family protein [Chloroflexi bacterium]|jgi:phosphomannomutase|nr:phosphoglucomutase/phosphomannomutase family protein [Chloroflexota bacterium]MBT7080850.1 phosphoglucomutase/phosphomannomutase family protein [Chloroflexota bacterium]MBT7289703.1 phosphoglucomutase/phosphomannomutase family protein [Chloroflexota bacterium]
MKQDSPIKFGTDGWRAVIAKDFTFDNVRICAQAVANYLADVGLADRGLVVGYDTRYGSERFADAVAGVIAANGIKTYLCRKALPTPVISHGILTKQAGGAIIITASHNPAEWNGLKYKPDYAGSASPEVISGIESHIPAIAASGNVSAMDLSEGLKKGLIEYIDPFPAYLKQISSLVDIDAIRNAGLNIAVDSMYGAGAGIFRRVLGGGITRITEINRKRNPLFPGINPEPITPNLKKLSKLIAKQGFDVGLATDGDADRIGLMDEKGQFITQLVTYALLALYKLHVMGERGAIVKTITTTDMVYRLGQIYDVPVIETSVGFKYVGPIMIKENALIGGEESGGYGFRGHIPERDGILAALFFLDMMIKLKMKPSQLVAHLYTKVGPHYYNRVDIHFPADQREAIVSRVANSNPQQVDGVRVVKIDTFDGYRFRLADTSWLLIRFSGTEPVLRIYAETSSMKRVDSLLDAGKKLAGV